MMETMTCFARSRVGLEGICSRAPRQPRSPRRFDACTRVSRTSALASPRSSRAAYHRTQETRPSFMTPQLAPASLEYLDGLRVAITGGTSGLGLALVGELRRRGAHVAFIARTRARVEQVASEHPGTHGIVGDV